MGGQTSLAVCVKLGISGSATDVYLVGLEPTNPNGVLTRAQTAIWEPIPNSQMQAPNAMIVQRARPVFTRETLMYVSIVAPASTPLRMGEPFA